MRIQSSTTLETSLLSWIRDKCDDTKADLLVAETDLIAEGLLDSVDFLELIVFVEQETGQSIDISQVDPNDLTSIAGLCRHVGKSTTI